MKETTLPTDKQYLYYLIISQLYSDGHMEAAMRLETSILETAGQVVPSNRLSNILSACLLSFSDVTFYVNNRTNTGATSTVSSPEDNEHASTLLSNATRKRLHSGPPGLYPTSTDNTTTALSTAVTEVPPKTSLNGNFQGKEIAVFPTDTSSFAAAADPVAQVVQSLVPASFPADPPPYSAPQSLFVQNKSEKVQSQLSKELEQICNAAVLQDTTTTTTAVVVPETTDILPTIKLEPAEMMEVKREDTAANDSTALDSSTNLGATEESNTADEATQNLIINLSNISNISDFSDFSDFGELTQSLMESLVQGNNTHVYPEVESNRTGVYNAVPATIVTSTVKEESENTNETNKQITTSSSPNSDYPALSVYKQSNNLLNVMGYHTRHKPFRRHRTRFNEDQVAAMERYYNNISRYARPDNGLPELIRTTGLTHDTIMLWFQNKRARDKRKGWDDGPGGSDKRARTAGATGAAGAE